ncbi:putative disease resistance RPP13-like protein 1 [Senna tora]|uniref:Putative disease resistance RPP13-like protein 1 n=1 Tax=Senna tora TaxID=362788 RepID=A0A834XAA6_9FABA|nr:putative disease resistance RPP13-like protein 1 [Senna tora]
MAAELVGGALLSATFDVLLERLTPHVDFLNFIRRKKLDQNLLHRLKPTLIAARAVLNDAELKQITDSAVKEWLDELRDAVYEVEDLMDEVSTKSVTQNQVCHLSTGYLNVHDREMGNKLEAIADRLELLFSGRARALRLRTFLGFNYGKIPYSVRHDSLSFNLTYLRVLSFADFEVLKKVPDCIGEFIHLRYLDLSSTQIESLPNSLCNLYNLQTLKLHSCFLLMMLPNDMQNLVNLRYLDIQDTALEEMPKGLSKLQDLHFLSDFIVGKDHGTMIGELGEISNLRDKLKVRNLENIRNGKEAYEAKMMEKKHLKELYLSWSTSQNDIENSQTERDILDKLQPHWDLQVLHIDGYRGTTFPDWLGIHLYLNMTELKLDNCINCWMLPPLGQLHSLKRLHISQFPKVVTVGVEFFKGSDNCSLLTPFASLEYLEFFEMPTWKEWHSNEIEAFPKLQELHMNYCLQLTGDLPTHLPSLKILHITSCPVLTSSIPNYPKLQDLKILSCIGSLLSTMALWFHILHLQSDEEQAEREMNTLAISNSVLLSNAHLENLEKIQIEGCKDLKCLSNHANHLLPNLKKLSITGCPDFEPFLEGSLPSSLRELEISYCDKLLDRYMEWHLPNLTHLCISSKHDSIKCFPEEGFLPVTLITLELFGLTSLETLNCKGLHHLTSLQELSICVSPKLKKMEGGQVQLPASLKRLRLKKCGLLEERCYAKDAEIWPKICHIPVIEINYKFPHETLLEELAEESSQEEEFQA